jgi:hypothetical protein
MCQAQGLLCWKYLHLFNNILGFVVLGLIVNLTASLPGSLMTLYSPGPGTDLSLGGFCLRKTCIMAYMAVGFSANSKSEYVAFSGRLEIGGQII